MQSKKELNNWYSQKDPWGYETNPDDLFRKEAILEALKDYGVFKRACDLGAGEGFITRDLPSKEIYAYEISDNAASRFPDNVKHIQELEGEYDLIVATGVMYEHYDHRSLIDLIKKHASRIVLLSNIKEWEVDLAELGTPVYMRMFPYRDYNQRLRVYEYDKRH